LLARLLERPLLAEASVLEREAVVLVREAPDRLACCLVQAGCPVAVRALPFPPDRDAIDALVVWVHEHLAAERPPAVYHHAETDAMQLLAHWMHLHRGRLRLLRRRPDEPMASFSRRLRHGLRHFIPDQTEPDASGASEGGA